MKHTLESLSTQKYGQLTVKGDAEVRFTSGGRKIRRISCLCDCGVDTVVDLGDLLSGGTTRCSRSCRLQDTPHQKLNNASLEYKREYKTWASMNARCYKETTVWFEYYGGIGVTVCDRWNPKKSPEYAFLNFLEDMGVRPEGMSLNRINGAEVYSKETCEWATLSIQAYDQRIKSTNKSGKAGVFWHERDSRWLVSIGFKCKRIHLGSFVCIDDAISAREDAELKYYGAIKKS